MAALAINKVVSSLPGTLAANTVYYVRVGTGFDMYVTNSTGTIVAYAMNAAGEGTFTGGTLTSPLNEAPSATIASAATVDVGAASGNTITITGTTTITSFGTIAAGARRLVVFSGILTVTYNATSLILPTAANIVTAAGDAMELISLGSGNWKCVTFTRASGAPLAKGLVNFSDTLNSATPNASIVVAALTAISGANSDLALIVKGTGSLLANVPDNGVNGGGKRGSNSVDWQMNRTAASQVASGLNSTIGGGTTNTASGSYTVVAGGINNRATANYSCVLGGTVSVASGLYSCVLGGYTNTASGNSAVALGGSTNTASGANSITLGGTQADDRGMTNSMTHASGKFSTQGDAQWQQAELRCSTSNATTTNMTSDGAGATASNTFTLPDNSAFNIAAKIIARSSTGNVAAFELTAVIKRGTGAGSTTLVGTPTITTIGADEGAVAWVVAATANTTLGGLSITFTGAASTSIKAVASVESVQVVG